MSDQFSIESLLLEFPSSLILKLQHSFRVIEVALDLDDTVICFNGGKDSTVLLDLTLKVCRKNKKKMIPLLYFNCQNEFPEVRDFIKMIVQRENLVLYSYLNTKEHPMKDELWRFSREHPDIHNVLLGCRQDDPINPKKDCQMTDDGWAPLLRFYPLRTWTYDDIWDYLTIKFPDGSRKSRIEYCSLYDQGYSSIGNCRTKKNPWLLKKSRDKLDKLNDETNANEDYHPAWMLGSFCSESERSGR